MMKDNKLSDKLFGLLLIAFAIFSLTGCGMVSESDHGRDYTSEVEVNDDYDVKEEVTTSVTETTPVFEEGEALHLKAY